MVLQTKTSYSCITRHIIPTNNASLDQLLINIKLLLRIIVIYLYRFLELSKQVTSTSFFFFCFPLLSFCWRNTIHNFSEISKCCPSPTIPDNLSGWEMEKGGWIIHEIHQKTALSLMGSSFTPIMRGIPLKTLPADNTEYRLELGRWWLLSET